MTTFEENIIYLINYLAPQEALHSPVLYPPLRGLGGFLFQNFELSEF